ncbi:DUF4250 domain-containing protein [Corallincola platygyrae]|uniref:DUF4250 domain-containing protein n=1 Tax=Corallincola platygyrae TaxID=1193278 RepID=A0ABW4XMH1_9GAMM
MELKQIEAMDPNLLYSLVNMKLRNDFGSLNRLCAALVVDQEVLVQKLATIGYHYDAKQNQFRAG